MHRHGWYQIAFERDLQDGLSPLTFGQIPLMALKTPQGIRVFDAICPHRGAHLAHGGHVIDDAVLCPFHGHAIGLGTRGKRRFCIPEYSTYAVGGMVFARLSSSQEVPDLPAALTELSQGHTFFPGFELAVKAPYELVIENALDSAHFKAVHGLADEPDLKVRTGKFGELLADGVFKIPSSNWNRGGGAPGAAVAVQFETRAFSPGIVISDLHGEPPYDYKIISAAVPTQQDECVVRLTLLLKPGSSQNEHFANALLKASRDGLALDQRIWDHLCPTHVPQWTEQDGSVKAFTEFCERFRS